MFTGKTIRKKQRLPATRQFMRSLNAQELELKRLKKLVPEIERLELESNALLKATEHKRGMMKEPTVIEKAHEAADAHEMTMKELFGEEATG